MKILFITSSSINGGAQKHIRDMFRSLTLLGHEVRLAAPEGWLMDELSVYQTKLYSVCLSLKGMRELASIINDYCPDVTNTFILSGGIMGIYAWKKKKIGKAFVTVNNPVIYDSISSTGRWLYPRFYRWMSRYASAFLVKSDTVKEEIENVIYGMKPVLSIKNGIDFEVFNKKTSYPNLRKQYNITASDIVITNVAVLEQRKGQEHLIEAVVQLRKQHTIHLFLAGDGSYRSNLEDKVKCLEAEGYIHLLGRRNDVNCVLANSDIFVLASYHEGLPNSLMEAMAMGLPCVATDVGGVRQLIADGNNGIVVAPKSTEAILQGISKYLDNGELRKTIGDNANDSIKSKFRQETVVEELLEIYKTY